MSRNVYDPNNDTLTPIGGWQTVDDELSATSQNPLKNRATKAALDKKFGYEDPGENSISPNDYIPFYDTSEQANKKIEVSKLNLGGGGSTITVTTTAAELFGKTVTLSKGTTTLSSAFDSQGEAVFAGVMMTGVLTVECEGIATTVDVTFFGNYDVVLRTGFDYEAWLEAGGVTGSFSSLDDVLADEVTLRRLFTVHASVDYMAGINKENEDVEKIISNDLAAKWINLRDYALDTLHANTYIATYMDTADKYGYGEWALVGQVPKMTSNTAPYGTASATTTETSAATTYPYYAFDDNASTHWANSKNTLSRLSYHFTEAKSVRRVALKCNGSTQVGSEVDIQYSDDGTNWTTAKHHVFQSGEVIEYVDINDEGAHEYWGINETAFATDAGGWISIATLQFYAWAPKGNVPVMTANNAPYGTASADSNSSDAYKVFDGNEESYWGGTSVTGTNSRTGYITYQFANPICVRKLKVITYSGDSWSNGIVSGSNDGTNFTPISTFSGEHTGANHGANYHLFEDTFDNDDYYMYIRFTATSYRVGGGSGNYSEPSIYTLQFYGRELSDLVPPMISNTLPSGEAGGTDIASSSFPFYKAFDSDDSTPWYSATTSGRVHYKFLKATCPKFVSFLPPSGGDSSQQRIKTYEIVASNTGETNDWTTIASGTAPLSTARQYVELSNNNDYLYWGIKINQAYDPAAAVGVATLQFYGLDYSEKEFEESTTKKWLYDHGVEVVAIDAMRDAGSKQPDCLNVAVGGSSANNTWGLTTPTDAIDLTPYSLIRAKVGKSMVGTIQPQASTQKTSYDSGRISYISIDQSHNKAMIPNDLTLDISSVNQNAYPNFIVGTTNMNTDIAEWWLE